MNDNPINESPINDWLNFSSAQDGERRVYSIEFSEEHIGNPLIRALHGGVIAMFMEYAAEKELQSSLGEQVEVEAITINADYLRPTTPNGLSAAATITKLGRRLAIIDITAWQNNVTKPVAKATCSFAIMR